MAEAAMCYPCLGIGAGQSSFGGMGATGASEMVLLHPERFCKFRCSPSSSMYLLTVARGSKGSSQGTCPQGFCHSAKLMLLHTEVAVAAAVQEGNPSLLFTYVFSLAQSKVAYPPCAPSNPGYSMSLQCLCCWTPLIVSWKGTLSSHGGNA